MKETLQFVSKTLEEILVNLFNYEYDGEFQIADFTENTDQLDE